MDIEFHRFSINLLSHLIKCGAQPLLNKCKGIIAIIPTRALNQTERRTRKIIVMLLKPLSHFCPRWSCQTPCSNWNIQKKLVLPVCQETGRFYLGLYSSVNILWFNTYMRLKYQHWSLMNADLEMKKACSLADIEFVAFLLYSSSPC